MTGDVADGGAGGGAGGWTSAPSAINALIGLFWHQTQGSGRMAARGNAVLAAKFQRALLGQQIVAQKLAFANAQMMSSFRSGEKPLLKVDTKVTPLTKKLTETLIRLQEMQQTKKIIKKEQKVQAKLGRVQAKLAPEATYTYVSQYGLNNGPPVGGWGRY